MVGLAGMTGGLILGARGQAAGVDAPTEPASIEPVDLSQAEWQERLTDAEYRVLREAGTERPGSSPLNSETRPGTFVCAGCGLALFRSEWKYKSGTGWPSFFDVMKQHIGTREDNALFTTRTEYHCARCGGHQGHVFDDGPEPTGLRYCNNGVALKFKPSQQQA
jgi:peptide-methionine (R)-S-oxide reductase